MNTLQKYMKVVMRLILEWNP